VEKFLLVLYVVTSALFSVQYIKQIDTREV